MFSHYKYFDDCVHEALAQDTDWYTHQVSVQTSIRLLSLIVIPNQSITYRFELIVASLLPKFIVSQTRLRYARKRATADWCM